MHNASRHKVSFVTLNISLHWKFSRQASTFFMISFSRLDWSFIICNRNTPQCVSFYQHSEVFSFTIGNLLHRRVKENIIFLMVLKPGFDQLKMSLIFISHLSLWFDFDVQLSGHMDEVDDVSCMAIKSKSSQCSRRFVLPSMIFELFINFFIVLRNTLVIFYSLLFFFRFEWNTLHWISLKIKKYIIARYLPLSFWYIRMKIFSLSTSQLYL